MHRPSTKRVELGAVGPKTPRSDPLARSPAPPSGGGREFSEDAKRRIVEETGRPGATVSGVAGRYKFAVSFLFRWRQVLGLKPTPASARFLLAQIAASVRVIRIRRPKYESRACGTIHQAEQQAGVRFENAR